MSSVGVKGPWKCFLKKIDTNVLSFIILQEPRQERTVDTWESSQLLLPPGEGIHGASAGTQSCALRNIMPRKQ